MIRIRFADISLLFVGLFYAWFVLPAVNACFSGDFYNILFFASYIIGMAGLLFAKRGQLRFGKMVIVAAVYCVIILGMSLLGIKDASKHVRIGLVFFSSILLYFLVLDTQDRVKFGKYILLLYVITCITSAFAVAVNNSAARTITRATADDDLQKALSLMNVAGIELFQCMVMLMPALYAVLENHKIIRTCLFLAIVVVLVNASFTISLVLYGVAMISILYKRYSQTSSKRLLLLILLLLLLIAFCFTGYDLLTGLSRSIGNEKISERILNIRDLLYGNDLDGGSLEMRLYQYRISWDTFLQNPQGVGPYYAYRGTAEGIGYHSQILDDLARYGICAVAWYICFFKEYYSWLKREWRKVGHTWVASATCLLYTSPSPRD